ncbi:MAG: sensor histidine kinase [Acidobacteriota bacterium]
MPNPDPSSQHRFHKFELFWLVYLVFFFIEPMLRHSARYWMQCLGIAAIFLVLYLGFLYSTETRSKVPLIAGMWLLGIATLPFNGGAAAFLIYSAALLPFALPSAAWTFAGLAFIAGTFAIEAWQIHFNIFNTGLDVFFILVVGGSNIFFAQKQRADCKLRMAHEEIEALAALAERERIARDLHDVLGHTLSVIVLKAELANRLLQQSNLAEPSAQRAAIEIADVERTARTALSEVREAIGGYRSRGLAAEIETARRALDAAGVNLIADIAPSQTSQLSPAEETVLALALREAVTNIVRHAKAKTCRLRFVTENRRRRLLVEDDGEHPLTREGNGLRGMRERVEALGGTVSLSRNQGTHLLIELPLAEGAAS